MRRSATCPVCGAAIVGRRALRLKCPACGEPLRVRAPWMRGTLVGSLSAFALVLTAAGLRGFDLFFAFVVGGMPALFLGTLIAPWLFPPTLERDQPRQKRIFGPPDL
jgi:hypothetical protein